MTFEDMVPLIQDLNRKRELKSQAEAAATFHQHNSAAGIYQVAEEQLEEAKTAWFDALQKVEAAWLEVLEPLGLSRHDLRMAAL